MSLMISILADAFFVALLIWCSYVDMKKRIIPNLAIAMLICLGIAHMILILPASNTWWQYPAGLLLCVPFFVAWLKNGMGAGDVKLLIAIAIYLGLMNTIIAFALMIPVLIALMVHSMIKNKTIKCRTPFAPVLTIGAVGAVVIGYLYALA